MKRRNRYRYFLNLFSLSLLAIALYLNFVKKDSLESNAAPPVKVNVSTTTAVTNDAKAASANEAEHIVVVK